MGLHQERYDAEVDALLEAVRHAALDVREARTERVREVARICLRHAAREAGEFATQIPPEWRIGELLWSAGALPGDAGGADALAPAVSGDTAPGRFGEVA